MARIRIKNRPTTFEAVFFVVSLTTLLVCGWYFHSGALVLLCTLLSMASNLLNAMSWKVSYIFSAVSSLLYSITAYEQRYYGEAILHLLILTPLFIYCIFRWFVPSQKKQAPARGDVSAITPKAAALFLAVLVTVTVGYGYILRLIGSEQPYLNAAATVFVLGANLLGARRMKEQWYCFLGSNGVLIALWILAGETGTLTYVVQNALFFVGNSYGVYKWNRVYRESRQENQQPRPPLTD